MKGCLVIFLVRWPLLMEVAAGSLCCMPFWRCGLLRGVLANMDFNVDSFGEFLGHGSPMVGFMLLL